MLHQTAFFAKADGIFLECPLVLPREWVLEFGGKAQDIGGMPRLGPRSVLVVYDGFLLDIPVLQENKRLGEKKRTGMGFTEDMFGRGTEGAGTNHVAGLNTGTWGQTVRKYFPSESRFRRHPFKEWRQSSNLTEGSDVTAKNNPTFLRHRRLFRPLPRDRKASCRREEKRLSKKH